MSKGFTLVELSIVLVIIGLLIGGIIAAESMVTTARINNVVKQMSEYDVAVNNFHTKYKQLPGDSTLFPQGGGLPAANDGGIAGYDLGRFWYHLSLGVGLKNAKGNDYTYFDPYITAMSEDNCPQLKLEQNKIEPPCISNAYIWAAGTTTLANHYNYVSGHPSAGAGNYPLKPITLNTLDNKMDDGIANTGNIGGWGGSCSTGANYNLTNTNYSCGMAVIIGTPSKTLRSVSDRY